MKKMIAILAAVMITAATAYTMGRSAGIHHAIEDSEIFTVTCYNPNDPEDSAWGEYDQLIFIDLDGVTYEHGMHQG